MKNIAIPIESFRQFGKTAMLAELTMLQFYQELKRVKRKHRTLKDVINRNWR
jgi:hypothetical protein